MRTNQKNRRAWLTALAISLNVIARANAQSVIGYNFTTDANPSSGTQTNFTAGTITVGNQTGTTGVSATSPSGATNGTYTIPAADGGGSNSAGNNFSNNVVTGTFALATSSYDQVTITPATGYGVEITNFDFANRSTSSGPIAFTLRSSVDTYASDIVTGTFLNNGTYVFKDNPDFTLYGAADTPVTLRLYLSGGSSTAANDRIDDVFVTATAIPDAAIPVPEPASVVTLLGGALLIGAMRWKKRRC